MMDAIPARLLKLKPLADVPRSTFADAPSIVNGQDTSSRLAFISRLRKAQSGNPVKNSPSECRPQQKTFNAAIWLRFLKVPNAPVSLWLQYRDESGEFAVMVDEASVKNQSAMLSGCVTIRTSGTIEYMKACCGGIGPGEPFSVEELYVQRHTSDLLAGHQYSA